MRSLVLTVDGWVPRTERPAMRPVAVPAAQTRYAGWSFDLRPRGRGRELPAQGVASGAPVRRTKRVTMSREH